jgi:hypothetical protein
MKTFNEMRKQTVKRLGLIQRGSRYFYRAFGPSDIRGRLFPVAKALAMELICEGQEVRVEAAK